jgi:hypothetical protein
VSDAKEPRPLPSDLRDEVQFQIEDIAEKPDEIPWLLRRLAERAYYAGYRAGHGDGRYQERADMRFEKTRAAAAVSVPGQEG